MNIFTATTFVLLLPFVINPTDAGILKSIWKRLSRGVDNNGIVKHDTTVYQQDMAVHPDTTNQQYMITQPDMTIQPDTTNQQYVITQPVMANQQSMGIQQDTTSQQISNERSMFVDGTSLDILYWNSELGNNKSITIEFNNEKEIINYWIRGKPLKVITHGWLGSDEDDKGVFTIKTAYVDTGDVNVITVDWSRVASNYIYPMPAFLTTQVGALIAKLLENMVNLAIVDPSDIHVIGHSLGAHVSGACGAAFSLGKIGRVTGLDPAGPGFEFVSLQSGNLDSDDAEFVDVIHTAAGTAGYSKPIGHADFYPNEGKPPQPGCLESYLPSAFVKLIGCSHSRAHEFYTASVYHRKSFMAVQCSSWKEYISGVCVNNTKSPMGHDADPKARGVYYLETGGVSPFAILKVVS